MPKPTGHGHAPLEWVKLFLKAEVRSEELASARSSRAKAIKIGQFLSPLVGKKVAIQVKGRNGIAILRMEPWRAHEKRYFFEILWDDQGDAKSSDKKPPTQVEQEAGGGKPRKKGSKPPAATPARPASKPKNPGNKGNDLEW